MEEAEKKAKDIFQRKNYVKIEVYSCKPRQQGGYIMMSRGKVAGKFRIDDLEANIDDKGEVASYNIIPDPG